MQRWIVKNRYGLLSAFYVCLMLGILLFRIQEQFMPRIAQDEWGYWSVAAYFAGQDWSSIAGEFPYYSWGYGILLSFIVSLNLPVNVAYQLALCFNAILLCGSFLISCQVSKRILNCNEIVRQTICFAITMTSSNILFSRMAWCESLLVFCFWFLLWGLISLYEHPKVWKCILVPSLACYMYTIHQRSLGVLFVTFLMFCVLFICKKCNGRQLIVGILTFVLLMFLQSYIKGYLKDALWMAETNPSFNVNDYSGQFDKIRILFSSSGFLEFLESLIGKIYYINISTCFLATWGVVGFFAYLYKIYRNKELDESGFIYLFSTLCVFSTLAIAALYMLQPGRIDTLMYGRYTDWVMGIFMICGLDTFLRNEQKKRWRILLSFLGAQLILTVTVNYIIIKYNVSAFYTTNCTVLNLFYQLTPEKYAPYFVYLASVCMIVIAFVFYSLISYRKNTTRYAFIAAAMLSSVGVYMGAVSISMTMEDESWLSLKNSVLENVETIKKAGVEQLYIVKDNGFTELPVLAMYQYLLPDMPIQILDINSIEEQPEACLLVTREVSDEALFREHYSIFGSGNRVFLAVHNESQIEESFRDIESAYQNIVAPDSMYTMLERDDNALRSNGKKGFLLYGPYLNLERGYYETTLSLEYISGNGEIGFYDIAANGGKTIIQHGNLDSHDFVNGELKLSIPFSLAEKTNNVEFRLYTNAGTDIKVKEITYSYNPWKYCPGLDNADDFNRLKNQLNEYGSNIPVMFMAHEKSDVSIEYLEDYIGGHKYEIEEKHNLLYLDSDALILAEASDLDWLNLLEKYRIIGVYTNYILLESLDTPVSDEQHKVLSGQHADVSLLSETADGYVINKMRTLPYGNYEAVMELNELIEGNVFKARVYDGETFLGSSYVFAEDAEERMVSVPFQSLNNIEDLIIYLEDNKGKYVDAELKAIGMIENNDKYYFDNMLLPLINIQNKEAAESDIIILQDYETKERRNALIGYLEASKIRNKFDLPDYTESNFKEKSVDTEYLIIPANISYVFDYMKQYQVIAATADFVLLRNLKINGKEGTESLSINNTLSIDFYHEIRAKDSLSDNVRVPQGIFEVKIELKGWENSADKPVLVLNGNGRELTEIILDETNVERDGASVWTSVQISDISGIENLDVTIKRHIGQELKGEIKSITKISDGYQVNFKEMKRTDGVTVETPVIIEAGSPVVVYGPYIHLDAGKYLVKFEYNSDNPEKIDFDITKDQGTIVVNSEQMVTEKILNGYQASVVLETNTSLEQLELRTHIPEGITCELNSIQMIPVSE